MKNKKSKKGIIRNIFILASFVSFLLKLAKLLLGKKRIKEINENLKKFEKEEIKEILELAKGEETKEQYWHDSLGIFQEYFIPNHKNNHKPKILRTRSLITIGFLLMFLKVMILSYVFLINPFEAWMSELITSKVVTLVNEAREEQSLEKLTLNPVLSASALSKANDMIAKGYFAHFTPDGKKPWDFIDRNQYPYLFVGENLAMNFTNADSVHGALMDSPTHKKNIMNEKYNEIGIAMVSGEIDGKKTNVLVQMFASRTQSNLAQAPVQEEKETEIINNEKKEIQEDPVKNPPQEPIKEKFPILEVAGINEQYTSQKKQTEIPKLIEGLTEKKTLASLVESPNNSLTSGEPKKVTRVANTDLPRITFVSSVVNSLNGIFIIALIVLIMALIANILVRVRVQHKPVIIQTIFLLLFIAGLAYWQIDIDASSFSEMLIV